MRKLTLILLAIGLISLATATVHANYIYTYTGNPFTDVTGLYTTSDFVTVSLTLDQQLGNSFDGTVTPLTFSFDDGFQQITPSDTTIFSTLFQFVTDDQGTIVQWHLSALAGGIIVTQNDQERVFDGGVATFGFGGYVMNDPGTWQERLSVPDAGSTIALLSFSLAALFLAAPLVQDSRALIAVALGVLSGRTSKRMRILSGRLESTRDSGGRLWKVQI